MIVPALAFYVFAAIAIVSGAMVVSARNPVHSVLFLILAFFNAAGLFVLMGAEFLAMILVVVYVGAVAVMFMFVVMMLDINFAELRQGFLRYLPIGGVIGLILLVELLIILGGWQLAPMRVARAGNGRRRPPPVSEVNNTHALGQLLYTHYIYLFQAAGVILLIAMIGAIVLTHRRRSGRAPPGHRPSDHSSAADTIEIRKIPTGKGL